MIRTRTASAASVSSAQHDPRTYEVAAGGHAQSLSHHSSTKQDFNLDVMAHTHDTVESELNVLFVTTSLAVVLGFSIPATFSRDEYQAYVIECNAVMASNDTALIKESEWCISAEKYIWGTSYGGVVTASASFMLTMLIYLPWRLVRPSPHDSRSSEQFYHTFRWMFAWCWVLLTITYGLMGWTTALLFQLKFEFKRQVYMTGISYVLNIGAFAAAYWSYRRYKELLDSMENMIAWKRSQNQLTGATAESGDGASRTDKFGFSSEPTRNGSGQNGLPAGSP